MTVHDKKGAPAVPAKTPLEVELKLGEGSEVAQILEKLGEPPTAVMRFSFDDADPAILRALREACERNGLELVVAPSRSADESGTFDRVMLPGNLTGKPN